MKKSLIIFLISVGTSFVFAEDILVEEVSVNETQAGVLGPIGELDKELAQADSAGIEESKKEGSLIPEQPSTEVVAEPIDFFASDVVKDQRQGIESMTEEQIAQKLEQDNLDRQNALSTNTMSGEFVQKPGQWYMAGLFGTSEYDASNVESDSAIGFAFGTKVFKNYIIEGSVLYSKLFLEDTVSNFNPVYEKIDQYNIAMAIKVPVFEGQIFNGRTQPIFGVIGSYTRRNYKPQSYNGILPLGRKDAATNTFDVGISAGVDFNLTQNFALGFDYKYMFNLTGSPDSTFYSNRFGVDRLDPLEEKSYTQLSVSGKFKF